MDSVITSKDFPDWNHNRSVFPDRHVVVCEDDVAQQARVAGRLAEVFGGQGRVQVSLVPGGLMAATVIAARGADLVILDHDMPNGTGSALISWMHQNGHCGIPVLTFSGIAANNEKMAEMASRLGFKSVRVSSKNEVCDGTSDGWMSSVLGL